MKYKALYVPSRGRWFVGAGGMMSRREAQAEMDRLNAQPADMDVESGLGIGGIGSDDYNIHTEAERPGTGYMHGDAPAGTQVCPAGTTYGKADPDGRCTRCGQPADWNPGAGQNLCARHWDEY
jgi:hypothetical protein